MTGTEAAYLPWHYRSHDGARNGLGLLQVFGVALGLRPKPKVGTVRTDARQLRKSALC